MCVMSWNEALVQEIAAMVEQKWETRTPFTVKVDAPWITYVIWTGSEQHSKDAYYYDLGDRVVRGHVPLIEMFDSVSLRMLKVKARRLLSLAQHEQ